MTEFAKSWHAHNGPLHPQGYRFKEILKHRWFRTHSLPESRRYAETPDEMRTIIERYNQVATDVLGEGSNCFLVHPRYEVDEEVVWSEDMKVELKRHRALDFVVYEPDPDFGHEHWYVYAALTVWEGGRFDEILEKIANDECRGYFWFNPATGRVFSPYDGGADHILEDVETRDKFKQKYAGWLSNHPSGY